MMMGWGMLKAKHRQRTLADAAEVRGHGFFHGSDVRLHFRPAAPERESSWNGLTCPIVRASRRGSIGWSRWRTGPRSDRATPRWK